MTLRYDTRSRVSTYTQSWVSNVDPDFGAFESIATTTLSTATATVTFSSIPQTYKHLQVRALCKTSAGTSLTATINSASTLKTHYLYGQGSSPTAGVGATNFLANANTTYFSGLVMDILDYTNTNKYRVIRSLGGYDANGSGELALVSGLYNTTDAATSIQFAMTSGNITQYSSFALYGIKG